VGQVALGRYFSRLSKYINFINFGSADLKLFNFKVGVSIEKFEKDLNKIS
jgi:hypothetical protein